MYVSMLACAACGTFGHHQELPQEEKRKVETLAEHVQQLKEDLEATGVERNMTAAKLAACEEQIRNLTAGTSEARTYAAAMNEGTSCELCRGAAGWSLEDAWALT